MYAVGTVRFPTDNGDKKKREASLLLQQFRGRHIKFMVRNFRDNRNRVKMISGFAVPNMEKNQQSREKEKKITQ
jgi:hypothetical protein